MPSAAACACGPLHYEIHFAFLTIIKQTRPPVYTPHDKLASYLTTPIQPRQPHPPPYLHLATQPTTTMAPATTSKSRKDSNHRGKRTISRSDLQAAAAARASTSIPTPPSPAVATPPSTAKRRAEHDPRDPTLSEPDTELVFEDPYGDEFDDEDVAPAVQPAENVPQIVNPMLANDAVVFRPGRDELADGEQLVCDESAYDVLHKCTVEWPALSFDFVCMSAAGEYDNLNAVPLHTYPLSVSVVMGTQAERANKNMLVCARMSNMHRSSKARNGVQTTRERDSDSDSSDDEVGDHGDDDNPPIGIDTNAILQSANIRMDSTINRVRVMPQRANIVAVWTEARRLCLVDAASALDTLNLDSRQRMRMNDSTPPSAVKPFYSFNGHRTEGFGLDWSRVAPGKLLSGAFDGSIYLSEPVSTEGSGWTTSPNRFRAHKSAVEDIQWSPNEPTVFASCSSDKSIRFWDTREYRKPALAVARAHTADVNVISWNRNETHLLLSGGDDGIIKVWDLRSLDRQGDNASAKPAAEFAHHQKPITSVHWHPRDSSMLCASSEDDSISIWDLAVERDAEEELREGVVVSGAEDFPPQLLFIHMGQSNIKEAQWHPACPSLIVSTAQDGLNIFQPSNVTLPT